MAVDESRRGARAVDTASRRSDETQTPPSSSDESVQSARPPTAAVLWAHGDPGWEAHEEEAWQNTVLAFTHLLCADAIDADLDLFHGHTATDWARFGPRAIRDSDYVLVAVSPTGDEPGTMRLSPASPLVRSERPTRCVALQGESS
jgi:hypothetical protein